MGRVFLGLTKNLWATRVLRTADVYALDTSRSVCRRSLAQAAS